MKSNPECLFEYKTLESLDLPLLFSYFSKYYHFNSNTDFLDNFHTFNSKNDIELFYSSQKRFFDLTNGEEQDLRLLVTTCHKDFDFESIKKRVTKKYILEDDELYSFTLILQLASTINNNYKDVFYQLLTDDKIVKGDTSKDETKLDKTISEISKLIDIELRELDFTKHPRLSPIYKRIFQIDKSLRKEIQTIAKEWSSLEVTSNESHDIVESHYVIPVSSDRFRNGLGQIIYRSKSGQTLYIEPYQIQELINEKRNLEADFTREKNKLCHLFAEVFFETSNTISYRLDSILLLDKLIAHQGINRDFYLSCPQICSQPVSEEIQLNDMHHPLIKDAIRNNFSPGKDCEGLLISGPNTGGKTVLLKTIALNLILPHFGFYICSQQAVVPYTKNIHFISNDQQNLKEGLSSFSSETENYLKIFERIDKSHYIFIDEIFNSTTSSEASIISYTLISELLAKKCKVYVSSHHEQLKEDIFKNNLLLSAHMGFAKDDSGPTYKLHLGTPGHSHALDIFESIEKKVLGETFISRKFSASYSNESEESLKKQLKKLSTIEMNLHEAEKENKELKRRLDQEKSAIKGSLNLKRKELEIEFQEKWIKAKEDIFSIGEEIKRQGITNKHKIAVKIKQFSPSEKQVEKSDALVRREPIDIVLPNMIVFSASLNDHGKVIKANKQQAYVQFRKVKSWVSLDDLYKSQKKPEKIKESGYIEKSVSTSTLFDARGMRREPFLNEAEIKVYDLINGDVPFLDIIHGHGDGILKSSLYKFLKKINEVEYDFVEGNQGTTRITLKK